MKHIGVEILSVYLYNNKTYYYINKKTLFNVIKKHFWIRLNSVISNIRNIILALYKIKYFFGTF